MIPYEFSRETATTGYGNLAPKTAAGKLVTMVYALIGIPVMLLFLSNIGTSMANAFQFAFAELCCSLDCCTDQSRYHRSHPPAPLAPIKAATEGTALNVILVPVVSERPAALPVRAAKLRRRSVSRDTTPVRINSQDLSDWDYDTVDAVVKAGDDIDRGVGSRGQLDDEQMRKTARQFYGLERLNVPAKSLLVECAQYELQYAQYDSSIIISSSSSSRPDADQSSTDEQLLRRLASCPLASARHQPSSSTSPPFDAHAPAKKKKKNNNNTVKIASIFDEQVRAMSIPSAGASLSPATSDQQTTVAAAGASDSLTRCGSINDALPGLNQPSPDGDVDSSRHLLPVVHNLQHQHHHQQQQQQQQQRRPVPRDGNQLAPAGDADADAGAAVCQSAAGVNRRRWTQKRRVPVVIVLAFLVGYVCLGALVFSTWEDWSFLDGAYFSFITLSTIGFGDLVPGSNVLNTDSAEGQYKLVLCCLYLVIGLAVIAMSFNLVQEEVVAKFQWLGQEMGILDEK